MKYITSIFSTGALRKTPPGIIRSIVHEITENKQHTIIEFGAGQGEITFPVVHEKYGKDKKNIAYYAFEIDKKFSDSLHQALPEVNIISEDALNFQEFIPTDLQANYIICSMPLSFYSRQKVRSFLDNQLTHLAVNGKIIILFHAFWLIPFLKKRFPRASLRWFKTIPPYFLLVYQKK